MIDKRLLTDEVAVRLVRGLDEFGKKEFSSGFSLAPVRFDRSVTSGGANQSKTKNKPGIIFVYSKHCPDIVVNDVWLGAEIVDGEQTYTVQGYRVNTFNGRIFSYEIEVV